MKKRNFLVTMMLLTFVINLYGQKWQSIFFTMDMPDNWTEWEMKGKNKLPLDTKYQNIKMYTDILSAPGPRDKRGAVLSVRIFIADNGEKVDYKIFLSDNKKSDPANYHNDNNNMIKYEKEEVIEAFRDSKLVDFYETKWWIQGEKRVYFVRFGSYTKSTYLKYLNAVKDGIKTFKEK